MTTSHESPGEQWDRHAAMPTIYPANTLGATVAILRAREAEPSRLLQVQRNLVEPPKNRGAAVEPGRRIHELGGEPALLVIERPNSIARHGHEGIRIVGVDHDQVPQHLIVDYSHLDGLVA